MPSMKGLSMNRVIGGIKKRTGTGLGGGSSSDDPSVAPPNETVEASAIRSLRQFCEAGKPNSQGDEVLYLPPIVEAAESSPAAASELARQIRKYLTKDYKAKASWQYNAIMVMRILTDNPGKSFTRNIDKKFIDVVRDLLKANRDPSVQQILMETLDVFENSKADDEGLAELIAMWKHEKERAWSRGPQHAPPMMQSPPWQHMQQSQNYFARSHSNRRLPNPVELASRLEEARTSAKLLSQVVLNTPPDELLNNDLVKEFADRCHSASRSMQMYMVAEDPAPDNDTMESIIDTNEQLQSALSQHQRAILSARKKLGLNSHSEHNSPNVMSPAINANQPPFSPPGSRPSQQQQQQQQPPSAFSNQNPPPPGQSTSSVSKLFSRKSSNKSGETFEPPPGPPPPMASQPPPNAAPVPASAEASRLVDVDDDPFRDPQPESAPPPPSKSPMTPPESTRELPAEEPRLAFEPYHPGFKPTPSYLNRQESAFDHTTMHGAAAGPGPAQGTSALPSRTAQDDDEDLYGSNDLYDSSPKRAEAARRT